MQAKTSYKSFSPVQVNADIGLHIGLAGVNVTLRGESDVPIWSSGEAMAPGGLQLLCRGPWPVWRLLGPCCAHAPGWQCPGAGTAGSQLIPPAGNPVNQINETINYNEHFPWNFGADYDRSYIEGLEKGLPSPILYVAEKFSTQSPCAVHGQYRIAGHYTSLTLW